MKIRKTHFANIKVGQEFFSLSNGRRFRRILQTPHGYNALGVKGWPATEIGANQFVKAIAQAKEGK